MVQNAEIGLKTISDISSAQQWLRSTFLYVRLMKNAAYYKLEGQTAARNLEERLEDICEKDITLLSEEGLIERKENYLKSTVYGECMAKYYMRFRSMVNIMNMRRAAKLADIVR